MRGGSGCISSDFEARGVDACNSAQRGIEAQSSGAGAKAEGHGIKRKPSLASCGVAPPTAKGCELAKWLVAPWKKTVVSAGPD